MWLKKNLSINGERQEKARTRKVHHDVQLGRALTGGTQLLPGEPEAGARGSKVHWLLVCVRAFSLSSCQQCFLLLAHGLAEGASLPHPQKCRVQGIALIYSKVEIVVFLPFLGPFP